MKIVGLVAENVKKVKAIDVKVDGVNTVIVGGKNGAGKSSVLDTIAYALGGQALIPAEPIRKGESEARTEVDLGEFVVIRKFKREREPEIAAGGQGSEFIPPKWGPTKSSLLIRNKDGATYPSPQAMLDKLLGKLTFDVLKFKDEDPKVQANLLKRLVGLDTSEVDNRRKAAYDRRTELGRRLKSLAERIKLLPKHTDAPATEILLESISQEIHAGNQLRQAAEDLQNDVSRKASWLAGMAERVKLHEHAIKETKESIQELEARLNTIRESLARKEEGLTVLAKEAYDRGQDLEKAKEEMKAARAKIPDFEVLDKRLAEIEATNNKVRENVKFREAELEYDKVYAEVVKETKAVEDADIEREKLIAAAKFPIAGLGFRGDDGVTFNDVPFEQASTSEQLRTSVAIGLALNPSIKVLLIRNGNALDDDSLKAVAEQAAEANAQVWLEYVTQNSEGVTIMMEDGALSND